MSNLVTEAEGRSLLELAAATTAGPREPAWLREIRREARQRYRELGLPTVRDEEWRYTSLKPIEQTLFRLPAETAPVPADAFDPDELRVDGLEGCTLVFVNGVYAPTHSSTSRLPDGVVVTRLQDALAAGGKGLEPHLARCAEFEEDALTALNTALFDDGVLVMVPDGVALATPIHVLNVILETPPLLVNPRLLIVAGESASAVVVEDYVGIGDGVYLTNAVTEIVVGPNADVHHYFLERESPRAFNISSLKVSQQRDSRFASHSMLVGGALVRNNVNPVLEGEGCDSLLNGLYVGRGGQHLDNHMRVVHAKGHCNSRQYYKGILADEAHGVFSGRIVVVQDAQKTDAVQSNANLLLSDRAQAQTKPQLEIYADDVKCTHGATIGELDEEAVFYFQTRGLSAAAARRMLVLAFANESVERIDLAPLREAVGRMIVDRLTL